MNNHKIAVVGAGFSGLLTAYELQKQGAEVTVYEQDDRPGGQCFTLNAAGSRIEMGCVFGTSEAFQNLCDELQINTRREYFYRQYIDSQGQKIPLLDDSSIAEFKEQYQRLPSVLSEYRDCLNTPGFHTIPDDLKTDFTSWCRLKNLASLIPVYSAFFSCYGYGELDTIPAVYVLKHLDLESLGYLVESRKVLTFSDGSSSLCNALARELKDIRYGNKISQLIPRENHVALETAFGTDEISKVILTAPMPGKAVAQQFFSMFLDSIQLNTANTFVYRISDRGLTDSFFMENRGLEGSIRLIHINTSFLKDNQIVTVYSNGSYTPIELNSILMKQLEKLKIKSPRLIANKSWRFFPHLPSDSLQSGLYEELYNRQGEDGIFIGPGLSCCASLDKITDYSDYFLKTWFR
ncbi:MAG: FAD-dependent oxidoreductase [Spirochaetales bacterium]|nr:FAD-dependent oxidoreductase [Spirochaetales bacterium]